MSNLKSDCALSSHAEYLYNSSGTMPTKALREESCQEEVKPGAVLQHLPGDEVGLGLGFKRVRSLDSSGHQAIQSR